jgi:hypothetical protein
VKAEQSLEGVVNGGFETGDLTGWSVSSEGAGSVTVVTTNPHSGQYCACITGLNSITQTFEGIRTSSIQSITVWERGDISANLQILELGYSDGVWDEIYGTIPTSWTLFNVTSNLETDKVLVGIFFGSWTTGNQTILENKYIDDVSILYSPQAQQSSTFVSCSPNFVSAGSPVTCTATVSGSNATGTVTWSTSSNGTGYFSQSVCTLSSGSCFTTYTDNNTGYVTITASYSGDSNNLPSSNSTTLTVFVNVTSGTNVMVAPTNNLELTFSNVTTPGIVVANATPTVQAPPLDLVGPYYNIKVTAGFSGNVTVSLAFDGSNMTDAQKNSLKMMQYTPIPGDINDDGTVDIYDAILLSSAFNSQSGSKNWNANADINGDGIVDIYDAIILSNYFGQTANWVNITLQVDTTNNIIYGNTSHFSFIAIH